MRDALCKSYPDVSFFPIRDEPGTKAKAVCARYLVASECLDFALALGRRLDGIWGRYDPSATRANLAARSRPRKALSAPTRTLEPGPIRCCFLDACRCHSWVASLYARMMPARLHTRQRKGPGAPMRRRLGPRAAGYTQPVLHVRASVVLTYAVSAALVVGLLMVAESRHPQPKIVFRADTLDLTTTRPTPITTAETTTAATVPTTRFVIPATTATPAPPVTTDAARPG